MKKMLNKNYKVLTRIKRLHLIKLLFVILKKNKLSSNVPRYLEHFYLQKNKFFFNRMKLTCFLSGRTKGVYSKFLLSRLELKNLFFFKQMPNSSKNAY